MSPMSPKSVFFFLLLGTGKKKSPLRGDFLPPKNFAASRRFFYHLRTMSYLRWKTHKKSAAGENFQISDLKYCVFLVKSDRISRFPSKIYISSEYNNNIFFRLFKKLILCKNNLKEKKTNTFISNYLHRQLKNFNTTVRTNNTI